MSDFDSFSDQQNKAVDVFVSAYGGNKAVELDQPVKG